MRDDRYILSVPLSRTQHVTIISNKDMTPEAWGRLERFLGLQRDIWAEDTPDRSGEAGKTGTGLAEGESGLPEGSSKP